LDKIWGIGFSEKNAEKNRERWGLNLLGIALMNIRKRIVDEQIAAEGEKKNDAKEGAEKKDDGVKEST
jgi:hypothetical protein